jgi:hypothetical protein
MAARALLLRNSSVAVLAVFTFGIGVLASQELSEETVVPIGLRSALRAGPEQFARAGAGYGLSMGIVRARTWISSEVPGIAAQSIAGRITIANVFELFRALHPDYEASLTDGLLKFRPAAPTVCDAGLATPLPATSVTGTDVEIMSRLIDLSRPLDDRPVRGGTVGSSVGQPGEAARTVPERRANLSLSSGSTLESALDRMARNLRGTVWMASEGTDSSTERVNCFVSMFRSDGTAAVFGVDLAKRN